MFKIFGIARSIKVFSNTLKSRTTKDQYGGVAVLVVLLAISGAALQHYGSLPEETVLTWITAGVTLLSPIASRVASWLHSRLKKDGVDKMLMCVRVMYSEDESWKRFSGTLLDAKEEGYDVAVLEDGLVVSLRRFEKTGRKIRLKPE